MFGESSNVNTMFPSILEGNRFHYDASALPQLQLFGDFTAGCSGYPISHTVNDPSAAFRPTKRVRDLEPNYSQQKLQISLNNNFCQNEVDQAGSILNPNTVSTGLRLSYEEKERNSSVTSAPKNMKGSVPMFPLTGSGLKYEIDRQREELDHYIKVQEDNMMKGLRELNHRQTISFLNALEKEVNKRLYEKDLEIDNLNRKNRELGEKIKQVTVEAQSWHYRAKYNESVVNALKSNIQQVMAHSSMQVKEGCGDSEVNDAASSTKHLGSANGSQDHVSRIQQLKCRACMSKEVLKAFHYPVTVTAVQFAVGTVLVLFMWTFNLYKRPKISGAQLVAILPLAMVHTLGNLFTNMSLGKVAVSFTHTIKAMEPFFSVVLSAMFLGEFPTIWVVASLLPIVGGVGLASLTEASFNWAGFWSAMASNLTNQSRNVLSKKFMVRKEESLDNITLFSIITIMSLFLLAPYAFFTEGVKFTPAYLEAAGYNVNQLYTRSLLAALCFHAYQQVSYMILQRVSPVTHSVGNCVKRVVVIVTSVLFFRTPVSPINALGTGVALSGVFLYSRVKRIKPKAKTE